MQGCSKATWPTKWWVFSDHMCAFLWTWTTGLYFLYGRLRDIISTDPSSSKMLMYWKKRKSSVTHWHWALTNHKWATSWTNALFISEFVFFCLFIQLFVSLPLHQKVSCFNQALHKHVYTQYINLPGVCWVQWPPHWDLPWSPLWGRRSPHLTWDSSAV